MKALVLTGVKEFEIQDLPTPEIQPNEVLINTAYAGVSRWATAWPSIRTSTAVSASTA